MINSVGKLFPDLVADPMLDISGFQEASANLKENILKYHIYALQSGALPFEQEAMLNNLKNIITQNDRGAIKMLTRLLVKSAISQELEVMLAQADVDVACLLVKKSRVLNDIDIIRILDNVEDNSNILLSAAQRSIISDTMADYIVSQRDDKSIKALIENKKADVSVELLGELYERCFEDPELSNLILDRLFKNLFALAQFLRRLDDVQILNVRKYCAKRFPDRIIYIVNDKYFESIDYFISKKHALHLQSDIDELCRTDSLNQFILLKCLIHGDVHSFIYGMARLTNSNLSAMEELVKTNIRSDVFQNLLSQAQFDQYTSIALCEFFKIIYGACAEGYLDSLNFKKQIKHRFKAIENSYKDNAALKYMISLLEDDSKYSSYR